VFLPEASSEVEEAYGWYESRKPGLGSRFLQALEDVLRQAAEFPHGAPRVARRTRKAVLRSFPYLVLYVVENERLLITGVFQARRDPGTWVDRVLEGTTARPGAFTLTNAA
jgi:plasmid stabilization system protein ParE